MQTHIDNVIRLDGSVGPVFTMSLGGGCGVKHMDMFPVVFHERHLPMRISTPVGSIILMDGEARLEWSHGIPGGYPAERWTIMLKLRQVATKTVGYSDLLDVPIRASPLTLAPTGPQGTQFHEKASVLLARVVDLKHQLSESSLKHSQLLQALDDVERKIDRLLYMES